VSGRLNETPLHMALRVEDWRQELLRSCYKDGTKVYGMYMDKEGRLEKRFMRKDGVLDADVVGAHVEGTDGFYRKGQFLTAQFTVTCSET
jgi:hypothetical protein